MQLVTKESLNHNMLLIWKSLFSAASHAVSEGLRRYHFVTFDPVAFGRRGLARHAPGPSSLRGDSSNCQGVLPWRFPEALPILSSRLFMVSLQHVIQLVTTDVTAGSNKWWLIKRSDTHGVTVRETTQKDALSGVLITSKSTSQLFCRSFWCPCKIDTPQIHRDFDQHPKQPFIFGALGRLNRVLSHVFCRSFW